MTEGSQKMQTSSFKINMLSGCNINNSLAYLKAAKK